MRSRKWEHNNPERVKVSDKKYYNANRERLVTISKKYQKLHLKRHAERNLVWKHMHIGWIVYRCKICKKFVAGKNIFCSQHKHEHYNERKRISAQIRRGL